MFKFLCLTFVVTTSLINPISAVWPFPSTSERSSTSTSLLSSPSSSGQNQVDSAVAATNAVAQNGQIDGNFDYGNLQLFQTQPQQQLVDPNFYQAVQTEQKPTVSSSGGFLDRLKPKPVSLPQSQQLAQQVLVPVYDDNGQFSAYYLAWIHPNQTNNNKEVKHGFRAYLPWNWKLFVSHTQNEDNIPQSSSPQHRWSVLYPNRQVFQTSSFANQPLCSCLPLNSFRQPLTPVGSSISQSANVQPSLSTDSQTDVHFPDSSNTNPSDSNVRPINSSDDHQGWESSVNYAIAPPPLPSLPTQQQQQQQQQQPQPQQSQIINKAPQSAISQQQNQPVVSGILHEPVNEQQQNLAASVRTMVNSIQTQQQQQQQQNAVPPQLPNQY